VRIVWVFNLSGIVRGLGSLDGEGCVWIGYGRYSFRIMNKYLKHVIGLWSTSYVSVDNMSRHTKLSASPRATPFTITVWRSVRSRLQIPSSVYAYR
jgi:hypothetical protein